MGFFVFSLPTHCRVIFCRLLNVNFKKSKKKLFSERLIIRPLTKNDSSFILELVNSEGWLKNIGDRNVHNLVDAEKYVQSILNNPKYFYYVLEHQKSKETLGIISFLFREEYQSPDLGFALLPQFEQKGYAYEACDLFLKEKSLTAMNMKIIAITKASNLPSISLLMKLGFTKSNQSGNNKLLIFEKD